MACTLMNWVTYLLVVIGNEIYLIPWLCYISLSCFFILTHSVCLCECMTSFLGICVLSSE